MTGWVQTKLVRPVPRAKRLLADGETFGQLAEVLMFPSGELASAVLGLIHDILDRNDPAVRAMALRSGLLYLALYSFRYLRSDHVCALLAVDACEASIE